MRQINEAGLNIIKKYEGCRLKAYKCPSGIWTIGYGHTSDVNEGDEINKFEADRLLVFDVRWSENCVFNTTQEILNDNQFSACVSLVFNIGSGNWQKSEVLKNIKEGNCQEAANKFLNHIYSKGNPLKGLIARRSEEKTLFMA